MPKIDGEGSSGVSNLELESEAKKGDEIRTDQSEIELGAIDCLQMRDFAREGMVVKTAGSIMEKGVVDFNNSIKVVESPTIVGLRLHREEFARKFEKIMLKAAREMQSTGAVWF